MIRSFRLSAVSRASLCRKQNWSTEQPLPAGPSSPTVNVLSAEWTTLTWF